MKGSNLESSCHKISISFSMYSIQVLIILFFASMPGSGAVHIFYSLKKMVQEEKENLNLYSNLRTWLI